jgi:hypothetical protein
LGSSRCAGVGACMWGGRCDAPTPRSCLGSSFRGAKPCWQRVDLTTQSPTHSRPPHTQSPRGAAQQQLQRQQSSRSASGRSPLGVEQVLKDGVRVQALGGWGWGALRAGLHLAGPSDRAQTNTKAAEKETKRNKLHITGSLNEADPTERSLNHRPPPQAPVRSSGGGATYPSYVNPSGFRRPRTAPPNPPRRRRGRGRAAWRRGRPQGGRGRPWGRAAPRARRRARTGTARRRGGSPCRTAPPAAAAAALKQWF